MTFGMVSFRSTSLRFGIVAVGFYLSLLVDGIETTLVSVTITKGYVEGVWNDFNAGPDSHVRIWYHNPNRQPSLIGKTSTISDSFAPVWNRTFQVQE